MFAFASTLVWQTIASLTIHKFKVIKLKLSSRYVCIVYISFYYAISPTNLQEYVVYVQMYKNLSYTYMHMLT